MKTISVALLGYGTVGSGTSQIIREQQAKIKAITGTEVQIKKVLARDVNQFFQPDYENFIPVDNIDAIISDEQIDIIVEAMGGITFAKECIERAIQAKKHVVTANKDLIALYGSQLIKQAKQADVGLFYEAAVAGGIPILESIRTSLIGEQIMRVSGILNGTSNFILTQMADHQLSYTAALKEAQELGYAEADPTADVDGWDAARKLVILIKFAFGLTASLDDIKVQGIADINAKDCLQVDALGYRIKSLGTAVIEENRVSAQVVPTLVPKSHLLAQVNNEMNAVYVNGVVTKELMFYGPGAGALPTGAMMVADIIKAVDSVNKKQAVPIFANYTSQDAIMGKGQVDQAYYLDISTNEEQCDWIKLLSDLNIKASIKSQSEKGTKQQIQVITQKINTSALNKLVDKLEQSANYQLNRCLAVLTD